MDAAHGYRTLRAPWQGTQQQPNCDNSFAECQRADAKQSFFRLCTSLGFSVALALTGRLVFRFRMRSVNIPMRSSVTHRQIWEDETVLGLLRLAFVAAIAVMAALPAEARRAPPSHWVLLGEQTVGFRVDRDTINIGDGNARFSQLRIEAEKNDVYLLAMRLVYQNGYAEDFRVDREIKSGTDALPVDLKGARSYLKQIELTYRARPSFEGRAVVRVYGELHDRWRNEHRSAGRDDTFDVIDTQRISRRDRSPVLFDVGRRDGRFARLRLQARDGDVRIESVRITFGNGETQQVQIDDRLQSGEMSRSIDLEGDRRFVRSVRVDARPARGERDAQLVLLGKADDSHGRNHGDNRGGGREEWVTLGVNRAAMLGADTDTFQVGRDMGTFRAIRVAVSKQDVRFISMSIRYGNGETEDVPLAGVIRAGEVSKPYDLKGRDRFIESVTFKYRSKLSLKGSGRVEIQGLKHGAYRDR